MAPPFCRGSGLVAVRAAAGRGGTDAEPDGNPFDRDLVEAEVTGRGPTDPGRGAQAPSGAPAPDRETANFIPPVRRSQWPSGQSANRTTARLGGRPAVPPHRSRQLAGPRPGTAAESVHPLRRQQHPRRLYRLGQPGGPRGDPGHVRATSRQRWMALIARDGKLRPSPTAGRQGTDKAPREGHGLKVLCLPHGPDHRRVHR